ncbi:MAG: 2-oxo acid dehydrogenase subunit E2, partial [SAR324 cluster bacterium]|nr:2-oxo acid dehydrogenase subunit E2 [SAR324 cluster bacterium]
MAKEFKLPDLGDGIKGGDVINILVAPGDTLQVNDPVIEIETDKATVEVPCDIAGKIVKILVKTGDHIEIGASLMTLETAEAAESSAPARPVTSKQATAPASPPPVQDESHKAAPSTPAYNLKKDDGPVVEQLKTPDLGDSIVEAQITSILISAGQKINVNTPVVEAESDKATFEIPSTLNGTVKSLFVAIGDKVRAGQLLAEVEISREADKTEPVKTPQPQIAKAEKQPQREPLVMEKPTVSPVSRPGKVVPASPGTRRFAREIGVDIAQVPGSGPHGRISKEDVKHYSRELHTKRRGASVTGMSSPPLPDFSKFGKVERIKMSNIREATARNMTTAWNTIPHVTQFDKANITQIEALRKQFKPMLEAEGSNLTITGILIKVLAMALQKYPQFNTAVDMENMAIVQKHYRNIGVAVETPNGLVVPVIRNADQKNLFTISSELSEFSKKARAKKLSPSDMQGGCITVTNLGGIAGTGFTPIVNWPETSILGVSKSSMEPVYKNGTFEPALMMPLSLS